MSRNVSKELIVEIIEYATGADHGTEQDRAQARFAGDLLLSHLKELNPAPSYEDAFEAADLGLADYCQTVHSDRHCTCPTDEYVKVVVKSVLSLWEKPKPIGIKEEDHA